MTKTATIDLEEARPYHHGDLRRALCDAARVILERDGPQALSLRAVAREAGVSPAAPYHHFKDKSDLVDAVAEVGWEELASAMELAKAKAGPARKLTALGVAYIVFARANPAIYRIMYDRARDQTALPDKQHREDDTAFRMVRDAIVEMRQGIEDDPKELELSCVAAWCMAHGLAEMASFKQFDPLKEAVGGEAAFFESVLSHLGLFSADQVRGAK